VANSQPKVTIPRVELLDELGRGGHSVVYRARREGRFYAVKLPLHGETGAKARFLSQRFRREAVALARVRHSALPAVMEVGEVERLPYIIMELATGKTLFERLREGLLEESQVVQLAHQLADALSAIHRSGLVHRDVKPQNVVFEPQTNSVKLVDFGFAASADARLVSEGAVGTLAYMAPEHLAGIRERVDGRADLFSLGCLMFEAATGAPPFSDLDPRRLLHQHERALPPTIGARSKRLSKPFVETVTRLLARDPDDRYPSADALRDDLARLGERPAVRRARARVQDPIAHLGAGPLLALAGREPELERLRTAWIAGQAGPGRVAVLRGPAGAGKTRLVQALLEDVYRAGRTVLLASCPAWSAQSFSAVRQLVEAHLRAVDRLTPGDRVRALARLRELAGDVAPLLRVLSPELARVFQSTRGLPHFEDAEHVFAEALTEFVLKLLHDQEPAFVLIDNVHWLDAGSRRVLSRVADRITNTMVLIVLATRDGSPDSIGEGFIGGLPREVTTELRLEALDEAQTIELTQTYLGGLRVDAEALTSVASLSDGSPLGTLEVLRTMLEGGVLLPWWGAWRLDREALARVDLPRQATDILTRRIEALDTMTRSTLQAAAVIGMQFDDNLLPDAAALEEGHVVSALAEARRSLLIEGAPRGIHRFVHDSVREALLQMLSREMARSLHQRVAECLDERPPSRFHLFPNVFELSVSADSAMVASADLVGAEAVEKSSSDHEYQYALARHYADGVIDKAPRRVFETNVDAARIAFNGFDNERSLAFFDAARRAGTLAQIVFDPAVEMLVAEAHLRRGSLEQALALFESVLARTADVPMQAVALSRIAWLQMQLDAEAAWVALESGFKKLNAPAPNDSVIGLIVAMLSWLWSAAFIRRPARDTGDRQRLDTTVKLYYLAGRLGLETAKPLRLIQATVRCQEPARRLGPSDALSRSLLLLGFVLTALGLRKLGKRYADQAWDVACATSDPVVQAHALQVRATIAAWAGDMQAAVEIGARSLEDFGHWRELAELCTSAYSVAQIESVRGRNREAWRWLDLAIQKVNQHEGIPRNDCARHAREHGSRARSRLHPGPTSKCHAASSRQARVVDSAARVAGAGFYGKRPARPRLRALRRRCTTSRRESEARAHGDD
jgi:eukaryotic-like serine/threonine-protein kinase